MSITTINNDFNKSCSNNNSSDNDDNNDDNNHNDNANDKDNDNSINTDNIIPLLRHPRLADEGSGRRVRVLACGAWQPRDHGLSSYRVGMSPRMIPYLRSFRKRGEREGGGVRCWLRSLTFTSVIEQLNVRVGGAFKPLIFYIVAIKQNMSWF